VLGYFARMCRDKGLDVLVEAYIELRKRGRVGDVKLKIGGGCGPTDQPLVNSLREQLSKNGLLNDVEFHPNLDRAAKIAFLRSLSVFSVPARTPEAFGLYVIESLAAGVPVVQPRLGAFPELVETTGGGVLYDPQKAGLSPTPSRNFCFVPNGRDHSAPREKPRLRKSSAPRRWPSRW
jgi:glycosyltransferase involved in cell wall biosynthesis